VFFGESMFSLASDASKVAFVHLVQRLADWSYALVDCQVYTAHLASLGATEMPRAAFRRRLAAALDQPVDPAAWGAAWRAPRPTSGLADR
jgi:leucyl/phenylalanyl-tRNA--protein transferase